MSSLKTKIITVIICCLLAIPSILLSMPLQAQAASITSNTTGTIIVNDVKENEEFVAVRVIETKFEGAVMRQFAPGFSYGNNSDNRSDDGLSAYLALSDATAIGDAVEDFSKQITDTSEKYKTISKDKIATFENLPMGQYVIIGQPTDPSRVYQKMLGNVEPSMKEDKYDVYPVEISAKYEDIVLAKPRLTVTTSSNKEYTWIGYDLSYKIIAQVEDDSCTVKNIRIVNALEPEAIKDGLQLNKDVKVYGPDGKEIVDAVIVYTNTDGKTVGFTIDIPGEYEPGTKITIDCSADTSGLNKKFDTLKSKVNAWCDNFDPVEASVSVAIDPQKSGVADELIQPQPTIVEEIIQKTGDILPYVIGGITFVTLCVLVIVFIRNRKK